MALLTQAGSQSGSCSTSLGVSLGVRVKKNYLGTEKLLEKTFGPGLVLPKACGQPEVDWQ